MCRPARPILIERRPPVSTRFCLCLYKAVGMMLTMTTGQLIFYCGVGLLILTVLAAIAFAVKKPKYMPEYSVYGSAETVHTQPFRNGYPTEKETIRRDQPQDRFDGSLRLTESEELERKTAAIFQTDAAGKTGAGCQLEETEILPPTEQIEQ